MDQDPKLQVLQAVLRVSARHPNLLDPEAFEELGRAISTVIAFDRLTVMVPEGPLWLRVYAVSSRPSPALTFGARLPAHEPDWNILFRERRPLWCDDMRVGHQAQRDAVRGGMLSFVAVPCRVDRPRPRVMREEGAALEDPRTAAVILFSFAGVDEARRVPIEIAQAIADDIGPALERSAHLAREHRLAMILDSCVDGMIAWDREGRITDANSAASVLTGRSHAELLGTSVADLLDPIPTTSAGSTEGTRHALSAKSRSGLRWLTVSGTVSTIEHDPAVAAHVLLRDLSQVVRAEREAAVRLARIHELEEQHRTLLDNAPLIIFRLDPTDLRLVFLNRHAERVLGVPTAEALNTRGFLRAAHADPEGVAAFDAAVARAAEGAPSLPYEARLARREHPGEPHAAATISVRGSIYPLLAEGGRVAAIEGVLADVSAEHAARTRLVQADRLSTLGTLAAGVAHEINNPAAFILLGLDLLDRLLEGPGVTLAEGVGESARDTLHELRDSIRRIVDIARDLRLFAQTPAHLGGQGSRQDGGRRSFVDVNRAVESALSLTRGQILERAQLEVHLEEVPPVMMDDGRLGEVVVNLLVNAVQAIPRSYAGDDHITVSSRSDGRVVQIEIEDTGAGIPDEILSRIWLPFFTTKGPDVGTGLGLSVSRDIVERAGGTILAENRVPGARGGGARFIITLPAAGHREADLAPASPRASRPPTAARVLIVDDEPALARALADEIGRQHRVQIAGSAEAALARLTSETFDVVLCDLRMPGMSGEALYERIRAGAPAQAEGFVFMTGLGFGADVERFLGESGRLLLEKPFPAQKALETIARVMNRRARG